MVVAVSWEVVSWLLPEARRDIAKHAYLTAARVKGSCADLVPGGLLQPI